MDRSVAEVMRGVVDRLSLKYGTGEAKAMGRIIFENMKGWSAVDLAIKANEPMTDFMAAKIDGVVDRLLNDEPIQYIFGVADFYGMKLKVTADTLIPRPETAELVDIIVKENQRKDLRVLDLGTGSGCIAIALARNLPFADVTAVDISGKALDVARENASALHSRVSFVQGDILKLADDGVRSGEGNFDVIVSNPPYIADSERSGMEKNVLEHEPASALFVPDDNPLEFYDAILKFAVLFLADGGRVYFEINPRYVREMVSLCRTYGFDDVDEMRDSYGKLRFLRAMRPG